MFFCDKLDRTEEDLCRRKDFDFPLLKHDISIYSRVINSEDKKNAIHHPNKKPATAANASVIEAHSHKMVLDYHNLSSFSQKSGPLPQKLQSMFVRSGQNRRCVVKSTCNSGTMCSTCGVFSNSDSKHVERKHRKLRVLFKIRRISPPIPLPNSHHTSANSRHTSAYSHHSSGSLHFSG